MSNTTKTQKNDIDTYIRVRNIGCVLFAAVIIVGLVNAANFTTYAAAIAHEGGAQKLFALSVLTFVWAMPVWGIYVLSKTSAGIVILKREKELAEEHQPPYPRRAFSRSSATVGLFIYSPSSNIA